MDWAGKPPSSCFGGPHTEVLTNFLARPHSVVEELLDPAGLEQLKGLEVLRCLSTGATPERVRVAEPEWQLRTNGGRLVRGLDRLEGGRRWPASATGK